MVESDATSIKIGHALGARNEMKTIADELRGLAEARSISTPAMDRLYTYLDPSTEPVPAGSSEIPVNWNALWIALGALALLAASLSLILCYEASHDEGHFGFLVARKT